MKILIVDDEEEVFNVTQLAISGYEIFGKQCRLLYAPSAKEACRVLDANPDIALVLLDIVMETDTAGINVIEYIRKRLSNPTMRIVIRTGQPGVIPEENMLREYDIDDYREKTELTAQKLRTLIRSNVHSFMDIMQVNRQNIALTDIVGFSKVLLTAQTQDSFEAAIYQEAQRNRASRLEPLRLPERERLLLPRQQVRQRHIGNRLRYKAAL